MEESGNNMLRGQDLPTENVKYRKARRKRIGAVIGSVIMFVAAIVYIIAVYAFPAVSGMDSHTIKNTTEYTATVKFVSGTQTVLIHTEEYGSALAVSRKALPNEYDAAQLVGKRITFRIKSRQSNQFEENAVVFTDIYSLSADGDVILDLAKSDANTRQTVLTFRIVVTVISLLLIAGGILILCRTFVKRKKSEPL